MTAVILAGGAYLGIQHYNGVSQSTLAAATPSASTTSAPVTEVQQTAPGSEKDEKVPQLTEQIEQLRSQQNTSATSPPILERTLDRPVSVSAPIQDEPTTTAPGASDVQTASQASDKVRASYEAALAYYQNFQEFFLQDKAATKTYMDAMTAGGDQNAPLSLNLFKNAAESFQQLQQKASAYAIPPNIPNDLSDLMFKVKSDASEYVGYKKGAAELLIVVEQNALDGRILATYDKDRESIRQAQKLFEQATKSGLENFLTSLSQLKQRIDQYKTDNGV